MLITDQIASFVPSPLRGANVDELGVRFPDMSQVYDKELQLLVKKAALGLDIDLKEGTYLQLSGPQFETPKEVAMCRTLGCRWYEYGMRGDRSASYGHARCRYFLHFQSGMRYLSGSPLP